MNKKSRVTVFERTQIDEEKLSDAIANLEMAEYDLGKMCSAESSGTMQNEKLDEIRTLVRDTLEYLRGVEIRNEIEDFSHFNDIES